MCVCVWSHFMFSIYYVFAQFLRHEQNATQSQFLGRSSAYLNSEFSFPLSSRSKKASKEIFQVYSLSVAGV